MTAPIRKRRNYRQREATVATAIRIDLELLNALKRSAERRETSWSAEFHRLCWIGLTTEGNSVITEERARVAYRTIEAWTE